MEHDRAGTDAGERAAPVEARPEIASPTAIILQPKLVVGAADDPFEREADHIADQAVARIRRQLTTPPADLGIRASPSTRIRRRAATIGAEGGAVDASTARVIESARSGGRPLDEPLRRSMESAMGADFGRIRLHVGPRSDELNRQIEARAFTTGSDVFIRSSDYAPSTASGQHLIAHELAHTIQQGAAPSRDPQDAGGGRVQRSLASGLIQRDETSDEDETTEEDDEEFDLSSVTGDNGPTALEKRYDTELAALREAIAAFTGMPMSNATQIGLAKKKQQQTQLLMESLEELSDSISKKKSQADKLAEDWDGDFDGEDYAALLEACSDFEKLFPKAKSNTFKMSEAFIEASGTLGIAEENALQGAAQAQKMSALRGQWGSPALAKGHFDKHKTDTGASTEEEYLTRASALNKRVPGGSIVRKTRDGDTLTMDTATKDFTVMSAAGKIRTFFRPSDGIRYFNRQ